MGFEDFVQRIRHMVIMDPQARFYIIFLLRIVKFNIEPHEGPLNLENLCDWIKPMLHPFHSDCYPRQLASYYSFGGISWEAPSFSSLHTIISSFFLFCFMILKVHSPSQFDIIGGI